MNEVETYTATLYIAGDINEAKKAIRSFCMDGLCVTVTSTTYIYTAGTEEGIAVNFINYPRFPKTKQEIWEMAIKLGMCLVESLCQWSFTVVAPDKSHYYSRRPTNS